MCAVDRCDKPTLARGMCSMHYQRWRKANPAADIRAYRHYPPTDPAYVDEIAVERALRGDRSVLPGLTAAERVEVARRMLAAGHRPTRVAETLRLSGSSLRRFLAVNGLAS